MTAEASTISETTEKIQAALRDYIEATYHVGHPTLIAQRRALLEQEGVLFRAPFIESTPRYQDGRSFADLDLDGPVLELFQSLAAPAGKLKPVLYDPPYTHQAEALEWTTRDGMSLAVIHGNRLRQDRVLSAADAGQAREGSRSGTRVLPGRPQSARSSFTR